MLLPRAPQLGNASSRKVCALRLQLPQPCLISRAFFLLVAAWKSLL